MSKDRLLKISDEVTVHWWDGDVCTYTLVEEKGVSPFRRYQLIRDNGEKVIVGYSGNSIESIHRMLEQDIADETADDYVLHRKDVA